MTDKLIEKLQKLFDLNLETIKDEVFSTIENLKNDFESELDELLEEVKQEERLEDSFEVSYDDFIKIITKGQVISLTGRYLPDFSNISELFLNSNGVIRPPVGTLQPLDVFQIATIELRLPSGKVLNTKEVKELFVD